jgi:hypothetical protein
MALTADNTGIKDYENVVYITVDGERQLNGVTNIVTLLTVIVGIGHITEKNAAEFYTRVETLQRLQGGSFGRTSKGEDYPITLDDVKRHMGLRTNVEDITRAKFVSTQVKGAMDEIAWKAAHA